MFSFPEILHKPIYVYLPKRKLLSPSPGIFLNSTLIVARYYRHIGVFLISSFFDIETKLKQQISQNTEEKLLYCTHCDTGRRSTSVGIFKSPVLDLDYEDDDILEPGISFSNVFNDCKAKKCI